jgi:hypothetical protein
VGVNDLCIIDSNEVRVFGLVVEEALLLHLRFTMVAPKERGKEGRKLCL